MKTLKTLPGNLMLLLFLLVSTHSISQTKADIFDGSKEITWLGIDITHAKFLGEANQFKDAGEVTNSDFRDKYAPAWNQLFIDDKKKYDVAEAVHRTEVGYATEITDKANSQVKTDFFSDDPDDYKKLDEEKIKGIVKQYDFKGKTGIGMLFIVDGMSKAKKECGVWVTFVDMKSKNVLLTQYETGKPVGFGFRNYWAGAFLKVLKDVKDEYKNWKKG